MTADGNPAWYDDGLDHVWLPYASLKPASPPLAVAAAHDCRIVLADGRELVDGCASWWTACHGHNHPHIKAAVARQLDIMPHVMFGGLVHEPALVLARRLADLAPGDLSRVFLAESGSVSVEVAMKMALQYWLNHGVTGRRKFAAFRHGYHGDTFGTMTVCDPDEGMHRLFKGTLMPQHIVALPTDDDMRRAFAEFIDTHAHELAAVLIEPLVQAAGGFKFHDEDTLRFVREVTARHDVLLIVDEIMTGFGRTGALFACSGAGIVPDIMTLSKALTGGTLPLSAAISTSRIAKAFASDKDTAALMHGPTFMANALACSAANASLDLFEREPRLEQVAAIARHLKAALPEVADVEGVRDVRVKGAVGVIELTATPDAAWIKNEFLERGVFIRPLGNVLYITPPFVIAADELARLTTALVDVTRAWSRRTF